MHPINSFGSIALPLLGVLCVIFTRARLVSYFLPIKPAMLSSINLPGVYQMSQCRAGGLESVWPFYIITKY